MILVTGPLSRFGHLCHSGLCVVLVPGGPVGLGGPSAGLGSQEAWDLRGLCFRCVLLCPGLPLFGAGTGMRDGGGGWSFIFPCACVFDTVPRRGSHFPELPLLCLAPPALLGFTQPQVNGGARSAPCLPLPVRRAGCRIPAAIPAWSRFVAGFGLAGSGIACRMLAAESGPLFISEGVVLSLSPSATEAGAKISVRCCGSPRAAAGVGAAPGGKCGHPEGAQQPWVC